MQTTQTRPIRVLTIGLALVSLLTTGLLWFGETVRVWWTARTYLQAVVDIDCDQAATVSVWRTPPGTPCTAVSMGFPEPVTTYRLRMSRVTQADVRRGQAGVGLRLGENDDYGLHLIQRDGHWMVDAVDVNTS